MAPPVRAGGRRGSRDLVVEVEPLPAAPAVAVEAKPSPAQMLREMEEEMAREVKKVNADRAAMEKTEKEAEKAQAVGKIEEATKQARELEKDTTGEATPDRLMKVRARRRSRDLTDEAKDLLGVQLAGAFKALDLNGDGTLDHLEVKQAFAVSGNSMFADETFKPILEDLLQKHKGRIHFEQFKDIAWQGNLAASPTTSPNVNPN